LTAPQLSGYAGVVDEKQRKITVTVSEELWVRAKLRAVNDLISLREVVREALEKHLQLPNKSDNSLRE